MKINKVFALAGLSILLACSAPGPVFPPLPFSKPAKVSSRYYFLPPNPAFKHLNLGGLWFKKIRRYGTKEHIRTDFRLQILGQMADASVRIRSYEGTALQDPRNPEILELASKRCYVFGKRYWEDRMQPIERWDCDHLIFRLQKEQNGNFRSIQDDRSVQSNWFGTFQPEAPPILQKKHFFSGRLILLSRTLPQNRRIETPKGPKTAPLDNYVKSQLPKANILIWGKDAGLLLRDGQTLDTLNKQGHRVGQLKVLARPGDIILARWIGTPAPNAVYAYTKQDLRGGPGLF